MMVHYLNSLLYGVLNYIMFNSSFLWLDVKYANMIKPYVRNFKRKGDYLFNFSCFSCGDSTKNPLKARGFLYRAKNCLAYKCHNCDANFSMSNTLKQIDDNLYHEYILEKYQESGNSTRKKPEDIPEFFKEDPKVPILVDDVLSTLDSLSTLPKTHYAVQYLISRKIPEELYHHFYYAKNFKTFVNTLLPNKFEITKFSSRLVIPYFNEFGKCFAFQGRSLGTELPKYYTIKLDDEAERIYGLDRIDYSKPIVVVEGPIDSLLLPNALAVSGASFDSSIIQSIKSNATIVYDNEIKNPQILSLLKKTIAKGYSVCIWPNTFKYKDINEGIINGMTSEQILSIIKENTFNGLAATLQLSFRR